MGKYMKSVNFVDVKDENAIFDGQGWDALIVVTHSLKDIAFDEVRLFAEHAASVDKRVGQATSLLLAPGLAGGKLIIAPVLSCEDEYQDVRIYSEAAKAGINMASASGSKRPLLMVVDSSDARFSFAKNVSSLACAQALWQPLEKREAETGSVSIHEIGLFTLNDLGHKLSAIEAGKHLARDLCGTEPERMSAIHFSEYCQLAFEGSEIDIEVIDNIDLLTQDYPLLSGVARASIAVPRHHPRVVKLAYCGDGEITRTFFFAGKGVIYDTGGADIKVAGGMAGMSRDKGGAAAVAGLMKTLSLLKPKGIRVVAQLGLVRNSIGSDAFVTDEIITSHANCRVRIGNTDAEGRLVLADLLSHLRTEAQCAVAPELYSVATLTGHVVRCYGGYTAIVENSVAKKEGIGKELQRHAQQWAEPIERSTLRREDFQKIVDPSGAAQVLSSNNGPSAITARGHQYPAAFLLKASGLFEHGLNSEIPLPFSHIDIAGSAVEGHPHYGSPTACPVASLVNYIVES